MRYKRAWLCGCAGLLTIVSAALPVHGPPAEAMVQPCSRGLVALTFDDGPSRDVTARLLDVLENHRVPATFFVVGQRVADAPWLTRDASNRGFTIANHSYAHERLTTLSDGAVEQSLRRTRRSIVRSGARPSNLVRAPYGLIDARVRRVMTEVGLTHVGWNVAPADWKGYSATVIATRVLNGLHSDRSNTVLLHDGIANSPSTVRAVPTIIREARERGYCFAALGSHGKPRPPIPKARVSDATVSEADNGDRSSMRFEIRLDRPTSRETSVRVDAVARSATSGADFAARSLRVIFPVGVTRRSVYVSAKGDVLDEPVERFSLKLSRPRYLRLADATGVGRILDNDKPPLLQISSAQVIEPDSGSVAVPVTLSLSRPSGRWINVSVRTVSGTAGELDFEPAQWRVRFTPGETRRTIKVSVLSDLLDEPEEGFEIVTYEWNHVTVPDPSGDIVILPPG